MTYSKRELRFFSLQKIALTSDVFKERIPFFSLQKFALTSDVFKGRIAFFSSQTIALTSDVFKERITFGFFSLSFLQIIKDNDRLIKTLDLIVSLYCPHNKVTCRNHFSVLSPVCPSACFLIPLFGKLNTVL